MFKKLKLLSLSISILAFFQCTIITSIIAKDNSQQSVSKIPIFYSPKYDISLLFGLEKWLHPFDGTKYGKVCNSLCDQFDLTLDNFYIPAPITDEELLLVHTQDYLDSLNNSWMIAMIAEVPALAFMPNFLLRWRLLTPMKYAVGGTVFGADLALKDGWAINLSGGYHHAKADKGEGFCVYADIPLAIKKIWKTKPDAKVLVIDLDAHRGNGIAAILQDDPRVKIFDVYNGQIYPWDNDLRRYIAFDYPLPLRVNDTDYLAAVSDGLANIKNGFGDFKPDLIIYNAGTDIFVKDKLGALQVSKEGIIERDAKVFDFALANKIPILMVLSGGYTQESHQIISDSIKNLLEQVLPKHGINPFATIQS